MTHIPKRIVLDSSIFCKDYRLEKASFRALLDAIRKSGDVLVIPRIVLAEVAGRFEAAVRSKVKAISSDAHDLGHLLGKDVPIGEAIPDPVEAASTYCQWLEEKLCSAGATILDYPEPAIEQLVKRAVSHRKPFAAEGDKGFKDYLIWSHVLDTASRTPVVFVSANTKDFSDGQGGLHPDLRRDIAARGFSDGRVDYFDSLDAVVTQHLSHALTFLGQIKEELQNEDYEFLDIRRWLADNVGEQHIDIEDVADIRIVLRSYFETPHLEGVSDVRDLTVLDVRKLPSGEFLIEGEATLEAHVGFFIFRGDYYTHEDEVSATRWNDHYYFGETTITLSITFLLTFKEDDEEVTSCEVTSASAVWSESEEPEGDEDE